MNNLPQITNDPAWAYKLAPYSLLFAVVLYLYAWFRSWQNEKLRAELEQASAQKTDAILANQQATLQTQVVQDQIAEAQAIKQEPTSAQAIANQLDKI